MRKPEPQKASDENTHYDLSGLTTLEASQIKPTQSANPSTHEENPLPVLVPTLNPYPHTRTFDNFWRIHKPSFPNTPFPPTCTFLGTIKLHGANSTAIFYNDNLDHVVFQSRNLVLDAARDNKGTVQFLKDKKLGKLVEEIIRIREVQGYPSSFKEVMIAGELCGRGVNKGVGISQMEKFFTIFNIRVDGNWLDMRDYSSVHLPESRIFNIMNWQTWELSVDFSIDASVEDFRTRIDTLVHAIGETCPFARTFQDHRGNSIIGRGEGLVWTLLPPTRPGTIGSLMINFKTKSREFDTIVRIASLPPPPNDPTLIQLAERFVDYALTARRMEQGIEWLLEGTSLDEGTLGRRETKKFLEWVVADMLREEVVVMEEMGASERDVKRIATVRARQWFLEHLENHSAL